MSNDEKKKDEDEAKVRDLTGDPAELSADDADSVAGGVSGKTCDKRTGIHCGSLAIQPQPQPGYKNLTVMV